MSFCPSMRNLCAFSDSSFTSCRWSTRTKLEPSMLSSSGKSLDRMTTSFQEIWSPLTSFFAEGVSFSFTTGVSAWLEALRKRAIPMQPSASRGLLGESVRHLRAQLRRGMAAGRPGDGHEAQVDLAGTRHPRIERVANLADAFLDAHPAELDGLHSVGLAHHHLDLHLLLDPAMSLEPGVLLVGDEVGRLLEILDRHVDGLRELELVRLDHLHRRVAQHQLVSAPVDAVAGSDLEGEIAAAARRQFESARLDRHHARRMQDAVVQAPLLEVVGLRRVPVLVGGEEALEEVDPLEVGLLRHCVLRPCGPSRKRPKGR